MSSINPTDQQIELLIGNMEEHTLFARKQITKLRLCGVDKYRNMLKTVADLLNLHGPPSKRPEDWQKVWNGMRLEAQDQMKRSLDANRQTGEHNVEAPSEWVQRINYIFGQYGVGCNLIPEIGIYNEDVNEKSFICNETPEEDLFHQLFDNQVLAAQNRACDDYLLDAAVRENNKNNRLKMNNNYSSLDQPSTSKMEPPRLKLTSENLKLIASFIEGTEANGGCMTIKQWNMLAKKACFAHLNFEDNSVNGETIRSLWELEVHRVLNKHTRIAASNKSMKAKLSPTEEIIFGVVVKDSGFGEEDNEKATSNDFSNNCEPQDNFLDEYEEEEEDIEVFNDGSHGYFVQESAPLNKPSPSTSRYSNVLASNGERARSTSSTQDNATPSTSNTKNSVFHMPNLEQLKAFQVKKRLQTPVASCPSKKRKITGLQMQKQGVEAMLEGNDIFASIIDVLAEHLGKQNALLKGIQTVLEEGLDHVTNNIRIQGDRVTATMFNLCNTYKLHQQEKAALNRNEPDVQASDLFEDGLELYTEDSEEPTLRSILQEFYEQNLQ